MNPGLQTPARGSRLEIWGGFECSIVRIGDRQRSQIVETGHYERPEDIDRLAALGIRTMRYPVLWEMLDRAPENWRWADERMQRLRGLGVRPIVGLVHHGAGPRHVDLLNRDFASGLAAHAARVAQRYPWVDAWTPVNEPLTTARFSALYGHWHPHARDTRSFLRAVFIQCLAVVLSMREIRRVRPDAMLVQTEDLGRVFSTPPIAGQAAYENERRWLSLDLLCGRVDRHHAFYPALRDAGVTDRDLSDFEDPSLRPGIIGVNHYLTSDRFLDHRLRGYPRESIGGNGQLAYADVAAARVRVDPALWGPRPRLLEAWRRYRRPMAVTEVHNGSSIGEQLRWVATVHAAIEDARSEGADIRAMTAWACVGARDWCSLLMRDDDVYEPGLFDARRQPPTSTALAALFRVLAEEGVCEHEALNGKGWWFRADRYHRRARRMRLGGRRSPGRDPLSSAESPLLL